MPPLKIAVGRKRRAPAGHSPGRPGIHPGRERFDLRVHNDAVRVEQVEAR